MIGSLNNRETPLTLEQELLQKAANAVCMLYMGDIAARLTVYPTLIQREKDWEKTAKQFGQYSEIIEELGGALKTAYRIREAYPELRAEELKAHFPVNAEESVVQSLLVHLLLYRTMMPSKPNNFREEAKEEAEKMLDELGVKGLDPEEKKKKLTFFNVVESILVGNLKLESLTEKKQEELQKAVKAVYQLYVYELLFDSSYVEGVTLGSRRPPPPEQTDEIWEKIAEKFSSFSEKIRELREALKIAYRIRKAYPIETQMYESYLPVNMYEKKYEYERFFLTDILLSRLSHLRPMIYQKDIRNEVDAMLEELGLNLQDRKKAREKMSLPEEAMKTFTIPNLVESVLNGTLKVLPKINSGQK